MGAAVGAALAGCVLLQICISLILLAFVWMKCLTRWPGPLYVWRTKDSSHGSSAPDGLINQAAAQHSQSVEAWFQHIPGLKVVIPSNPADAKGLLKSAIRDDNPVIYFEHKALFSMKGEVPEEEFLLP